MNYTKSMSIFVAAAALGLAGCESPYPTRSADYPAPGQTYPTYPGQYPTYPAPQNARYGYVEAVEAVGGAERREGPGIGAIGGAIAGGVLGNQVGHGTGRAAATVGGAVIGGVVGHQVEQQVRGNPSGQAYRFRVRLDDGSYQSYTQETHDNIQVGDRVRVENGRLFPS